MSLEDKPLNWGPKGWLWALAPGLSGSNALPLPCPSQPCCSLTAVLSTIKALEYVSCEVLWWLEIRLDGQGWLPREMCYLISFRGATPWQRNVHGEPLSWCQELVWWEEKWGQWFTKTWHKRKGELNKCLWHGNMAQMTDLRGKQGGGGQKLNIYVWPMDTNNSIIKAWVLKEPGGRGQWVKV